ncbi:MAG TPA: DUF1836 domain-containing protein [Anaerovoracaceae bacterium]|nr:DUF1836 domain-containing protein [Anaerovoracaceae bacterium]
MKEFKLPRWNELPEMELYLNQVIKYLNLCLGENNNSITNTMINNYVKVKLIPAPENKKYSKEALATLFVIAILKPVYSIEEIDKLIKLYLGFTDIETSYNEFCDMIEKAVKTTFEGKSLIKKSNPKDPRDILRNVSYSFASQLYVRTMLSKI